MHILIVTKGHPFEAGPFFEVFDELGHDWTHVEQPEAQSVLSVEGTAEFDAIVMYDMPGIEFTGQDPPAHFVEPTAAFRDQYLAMLDSGRGLVFLHHSIASWPAWPEFAHIVGGRFHYQPATLAGTAYPDSGYRFDVSHTVEVLEADHPICHGLDEAFEIVDELYLFPVLEDEVVPLMRSTFEFTPEHFSSADLAIRGARNSSEGWTHPVGSNLVAWVKNASRSPVAYVQFGDSPNTYADANYRKVINNAIRWAASPAAHAWATERATTA